MANQMKSKNDDFRAHVTARRANGFIQAAQSPPGLKHQQYRASVSEVLLDSIREHGDVSVAWLNSTEQKFESGGIQSWWKIIRRDFGLQANSFGFVRFSQIDQIRIWDVASDFNQFLMRYGVTI